MIRILMFVSLLLIVIIVNPCSRNLVPVNTCSSLIETLDKLISVQVEIGDAKDKLISSQVKLISLQEEWMEKCTLQGIEDGSGVDQATAFCWRTRSEVKKDIKEIN